MDSFESASNYQNTASNALNGLHDDGKIGGTVDSWKQYVKSGETIQKLPRMLTGQRVDFLFMLTSKARCPQH
jgi:hypothetical protein